MEEPVSHVPPKRTKLQQVEGTLPQGSTHSFAAELAQFRAETQQKLDQLSDQVAEMAKTQSDMMFMFCDAMDSIRWMHNVMKNSFPWKNKQDEAEDVGGKEVGGEEVAGKEVGGVEFGGEDFGGEGVGKEAGSEDVGGEDVGGGKESGQEAGGQDIGSDEEEGDNQFELRHRQAGAGKRMVLDSDTEEEREKERKEGEKKKDKEAVDPQRRETESTDVESDIVSKGIETAIQYGVTTKVKPSSVYEFEVIDLQSRIFVVNLEQRCCQCREFQLDQFVCAHAVAACRLRGLSVYDFISPWYKKEKLKETYAGVVHPIGSTTSWEIPDEVKNHEVNPPVPQPKPGRRKKRRIASTGEDPIRQKCSRCGQHGHNRQTCSHAMPLSSTTAEAETSYRRRNRQS